MTIVETLKRDFPSIKLGGESIDLTGVWAASESTLANCAFHGVKQRLGDAFNTFKGTRSEKLAQALKVRDNLAANVIRAARETDAVASEVRRLAIKQANKARPSGVSTVDWYKHDEFKALVAKWSAHPELVKRAEAIVAASELDIEL